MNTISNEKISTLFNVAGTVATKWHDNEPGTDP
jgi:hypothetical protein